MGHRQYATGDSQLGVTICNSFGIHTWHTQCQVRKAPKLAIIRPKALTKIQVIKKNVFIGIEVEKTFRHLRVGIWKGMDVLG